MLEELKTPFGILDRHLSDRPYLLGDAFTIADVNVASICRPLFLTLKLDLSEWKLADAWFHRCTGRATYQRVLAME
jgi:glutathione S-transferase